MLAAPFGGNAEGVAAVEVVSVDDHEGLLDDVFGHEQGVGGAPGLLALGIEGETCGNLIQLLGHEIELKGLSVRAFHAAVLLADGFLESVQEVVAHYVNHFAKAGADRIIDGIIDDSFARRAKAVHLLEASVSAAHAGSKYQKSRFHKKLMLLIRKFNYFCDYGKI